MISTISCHVYDTSPWRPPASSSELVGLHDYSPPGYKLQHMVMAKLSGANCLINFYLGYGLCGLQKLLTAEMVRAAE